MAELDAEEEKRLTARVSDARQSPGILAGGLLEWFPPPEDSGLDARASAHVVAEVLIRILGALTAKAARQNSRR